jgi:predicted nuclease of restriction endonuclease-like (RecB) superfamily
MPRKRAIRKLATAPLYDGLIGEIAEMLAAARRASARAVNALMTATYSEIGRRIVEFEQGGAERAEYGEELLKRLSADLTARFGRGFSVQNLENMRNFYIAFGSAKISQTPSRILRTPPAIWQTMSANAGPSENSKRATPSLETSHNANPQTPSAESVVAIRSTLSNKSETPSGISDRLETLGFLRSIAARFPLSWSHYVLLIRRSRSPEALEFYHTEALRGGWSVRQLARQIDSQFYERTALSRNKAGMLARGGKPQPGDELSPDDELKDPLVLEFLGLKDEYSETDLEEALVQHLEHFLLELGNDFAFIARQRRLRIDDEWFRVDLLFFHRKLRCLVVIDLKLGKFTHADAGQMHLYLNYAAEHWTQLDENPPVGVILCAEKGAALVKYATDNLPNKVVVREYLTALPDEKLLAAEIVATRQRLEARR